MVAACLRGRVSVCLLWAGLAQVVGVLARLA
jgi:hypothetical protein